MEWKEDLAGHIQARKREETRRLHGDTEAHRSGGRRWQ